MKSALLAGFFTLAALPALACSCAPLKDGDPLPDIVVEGVVSGVYPDSAGAPVNAAVLRVTKVIRGKAPMRSVVRSPSHPTMCGVTFTIGQTVTLAMSKASRDFTTNTCLNFRYQQQIKGKQP